MYDGEDRRFNDTVRPSCTMNLDNPVTLVICFFLLFAIPKCSTTIRVYTVTVKHNKLHGSLIYLEQHVSTPVESSSGPSKIQILN